MMSSWNTSNESIPINGECNQERLEASEIWAAVNSMESKVYSNRGIMNNYLLLLQVYMELFFQGNSYFSYEQYQLHISFQETSW